ncbi:unnamed protein product [Gongylonema pulchrum]|uniref:Uncharacterized protein n=1 Tax=Gongylonema pulchrum TaxID=637853 RepID=A0A3P7PR63_9BILA|nr:unnamed protein product [Gongylonema pulchrum]
MIRQNPECKDYLLEAYRYHLRKERTEESVRCRPRQPIPLSKVTALLLLSFRCKTQVRSVDVYDIHMGKWFAGPAMDNRRSTLGVAVVDQLIVAVGGFDGATGLSSAEAFDARQGTFHHLK